MTSTKLGDIDYVAQSIRRAFVEGKTQQQGKPYKPQPKFNRKEFWEAAAAICIELEADPYSFVRAAFLGCSVPGGPFANMLCGNAARRWFENYKRITDAGTGEDVYANEVNSLIQVCATSAVQLSKVHNKSFQSLFAEDFLIPEHQMPAYVRAILCPAPAVLKKWGRPAYAQILGNQRLFTILQEKGYNLGFLDTVSRERNGDNG